MLTLERLNELLDYNPNTGKFKWKVSRRGLYAKPGRIAGCVCNGYIQISIDNIRYKAHRLAFLYMTGSWPEDIVDHIDGQGTNNKWNNLRDVDHSTNRLNMSEPSINNESGYLGVSHPSANLWTARLYGIHIGCYPTAELAHLAYLTKKQEK